MAKYKLEAIETQADLDAMIKEVREASSNNFSDASARMQRKVENLEKQLQEAHQELNEMEARFDEAWEGVQTELNEAHNALSEAYEANNTYELTDRLNEAGIDPRYHDLVIKSGELDSDMSPEEFEEAINGTLEKYPAFGLEADSPLAPEAEQDHEDPISSEDEQPTFDPTQTMQ